MTLRERIGAFSLLEKHARRVEKQITKKRRQRDPRARAFRFSKSQISLTSERLLEGKFQFSRLLPIELEKPGKPGKFRGLSVPPPIDRVVHKAALEIIRPRCAAYLRSAPSYGVLKGRGIRSAVLDARAALSNTANHLLVADVKQFFNQINRRGLQDSIKRHANLDDSVDFLIKEVLKVQFKKAPEHAELFPTDFHGIPQGCALSPLFADIYLKEFDRRMAKAGYEVFRYIDDFLVVQGSRRGVYNAFRRARKILREKGLGIYEYNSEKCQVGTLADGPVFLGFEFHNQGILCPSEKKMRAFNRKLGQKVAAIDSMSLRNKKLIAQINAMIDGWSGAYRICTPSVFREICFEMNEKIEIWLYKLVDRRIITVEEGVRCRRLIRNFR